MIAYPAMLDVPTELVAFLAELLAAERLVATMITGWARSSAGSGRIRAGSAIFTRSTTTCRSFSAIGHPQVERAGQIRNQIGA